MTKMMTLRLVLVRLVVLYLCLEVSFSVLKFRPLIISESTLQVFVVVSFLCLCLCQSWARSVYEYSNRFLGLVFVVIQLAPLYTLAAVVYLAVATFVNPVVSAEAYKLGRTAKTNTHVMCAICPLFGSRTSFEVYENRFLGTLVLEGKCCIGEEPIEEDLSDAGLKNYDRQRRIG